VGAGEPVVRNVVPAAGVLVKALDRLHDPRTLRVVLALLVLTAGVVDGQASLDTYVKVALSLLGLPGAPLLAADNDHVASLSAIF
jgi:hypothetical protein